MSTSIVVGEALAVLFKKLCNLYMCKFSVSIFVRNHSKFTVFFASKLQKKRKLHGK